MSDFFVPPAFDEIDEPSSEAAQDFGAPEPDLSEFAPQQNFDDNQDSAEGSSEMPSHFSSGNFVQEETMLTNIEEYANRIKDNSDRQAANTREEADLLRAEVELELANALIVQREAEEEAQGIVASAHAEREQIISAGREEGFQQGLQEGQEQFQTQNQQNTAQVLSLLEELGDLRTHLLQQYENQIVELGLIVAQKVVHRDLSTEKEHVLNALQSTLQYFEGQGNIKIRINPVEYQFISEYQEGFAAFLDEDQAIRIKADNSVKPAAAVIESDFSAVKLDLEQQFEEMQRKLRECTEDRKALFR